jgi:hypothetical protein
MPNTKDSVGRHPLKQSCSFSMINTWGSWKGTWRDFDVAGTAVAQKLIAYTRENPARPFKYPDPAPIDEADSVASGE